METKDVTLKEMIEAMAKSPDHEVFRWYQTSYVASDGSIQASDTLRVTMKQARAELGLTK